MRASAAGMSSGIGDVIPPLRSRDPLVLGGTLGYLAFDIAALAASFAAFGGVPDVAPFVFAYVVGQLGGLIPLPGDIGGTDGGLIGALVLFGTPLSQATAAVLGYRAFQLSLPAILGTIGFLRLRNLLANHPAPETLCGPLGAPGQLEVLTVSLPRPR